MMSDWVKIQIFVEELSEKMIYQLDPKERGPSIQRWWEGERQTGRQRQRGGKKETPVHRKERVHTKKILG